jgi:hypothetical protein
MQLQKERLGKRLAPKATYADGKVCLVAPRIRGR